MWSEFFILLFCTSPILTERVEYGKFREVHRHPLEALDLPFFPETAYIDHEDNERYEDITNETLLYYPLIDKFVAKLNLNSLSEQEEYKGLNVQYVGWKNTNSFNKIFLKFYLNRTVEASEVSCKVLMQSSSGKPDMYEVKNHRCLSTSNSLECFRFKNGVDTVIKDIFYPETEESNIIELVNCAQAYGSGKAYQCHSEYYVRSGKERYSSLGCIEGGASSSSTNITTCNIFENELFNCTCSTTGCNNPFLKMKEANCPFSDIKLLLNQVVQRMDDKFTEIFELLRQDKADH